MDEERHGYIFRLQLPEFGQIRVMITQEGKDREAARTG
jgi:hypothetical protein